MLGVASANILKDAVQDLVAQVGHADVDVITWPFRGFFGRKPGWPWPSSPYDPLRAPTLGRFVHACLEKPHEVEQAELVPAIGKTVGSLLL